MSVSPYLADNHPTFEILQYIRQEKVAYKEHNYLTAKVIRNKTAEIPRVKTCIFTRSHA